MFLCTNSKKYIFNHIIWQRQQYFFETVPVYDWSFYQFILYIPEIICFIADRNFALFQYATRFGAQLFSWWWRGCIEGKTLHQPLRWLDKLLWIHKFIPGGLLGRLAKPIDFLLPALSDFFSPEKITEKCINSLLLLLYYLLKFMYLQYRGVLLQQFFQAD